jgi:TonB family protein
VKAGGGSGLTPARLTLPPGPVTVTVDKEGFRPWRKRLTLASGRTEQVDVRLVPLPAPPVAARPPEVRTGDLVALTPDVTPPRRLTAEAPNYPEQAQKRKLGGSVLVEFLVTETGAVQGPVIVESAGELLDKVSIEAVSRWRYQPAEKAGVKVKIKQQARFTFKAR